MHRFLQSYRCCGPYLKEVGKSLGVDLPVWTELQHKGAITDALNVVGSDALAEDEAAKWLSEPFSSGVHTRTEGAGESQMILMLWKHLTRVREFVWPPAMDEQYPEITTPGRHVAAHEGIFRQDAVRAHGSTAENI